MTWLLVDFGTTSTKSALVDLDSGVFRHLRRLPALPTIATQPGRHEVGLTAIRERFDDICATAWQAATFDGVVLCSEMHGFALLDPASGAPLTEYVSWLDARALEPVAGTNTLDLVLDRLSADEFRRITGMRARAGFPLLNAIHTGRTADLPDQATLVSLPGWLAGLSADGTPPAEHPTMLAAMALYDVTGSTVSQPLLDLVAELGGPRLQVGSPAHDNTIAGHWTGPDGDVPIYAGVGDHQASVLGAGVADPSVASINLGTGSQVSLVDGPLSADVEHRPFFDERHLAAVTHIPAGRALNVFVGFLQQAVAFGRAGAADEPDVWRALAAITPQDVDATHLDIDLAVFAGARGWSGSGGMVAGITEGELTPERYLAAILKAFSRQYVGVLDQLDPQHTVQRVALSGGIARNLPHLATMIGAASGRQTDGAVDLDESLLGLRALALRCAGRTQTVAEARTHFGRDCTVEDDA